MAWDERAWKRRQEESWRRVDARIASGEKKCSRCKTVKPFSDFNIARDKADGHKPWCRSCSSKIQKARWLAGHDRDRHFRKKFGVTLAEFEQMLKDQDGRCAICGTTEPSGRISFLCNFHIDHCHKAGNVRGLLCSNCNRGLGYFADNPEFLQKAIEYLKR
jgi:hypothetical protein